MSLAAVSTIGDNPVREDAVLETPVSISLNGNGDIFVCDAKAANIERFDDSGRLLGVIGRRGQGPGEFSGPSLVQASERHVAVWDRAIQRLVLFTIEGRFLKSLRFDQQIQGFPIKIRSLPDGRFVIETEKVIDNKESPQECLINLYSNRLAFIKTIYTKPARRFARIFEPGYAEVFQPFNAMVHWEVTPEGRIAVGRSDKYEIEILDPDHGKIRALTGSYEPVKIAPEDKAAYFSQMTVSFIKDGQRMTRKGAPDYIIDNTRFPSFKPAFDHIRVDPEGMVWVHVYRKDREREKRSFDAFSSGGEYLGAIEIVPPGEYPKTGTAIKNGFLWRIETDEDGLFRLVRYKMDWL